MKVPVGFSAIYNFTKVRFQLYRPHSSSQADKRRTCWHYCTLSWQLTILPILSDVTHTRNVIGSLAMASDVSYALGNSAATMFWCFMLLLFSSRNGSVWTPDRTMASEVIFCATAVWLWKHFPPFFLHVLSIILLLYYYVSFWEHDAALLANKMGRENVIIYLLPSVIRTGKYS